MKISNVQVRDGSGTGYMIALSWEFKGCRFHIWLNRPEELFKNPLGVERNTPGYFKTRHLDATAKAHAPMVAEARRIAAEQNLYEKDLERIKAEAEAERQKNLVAIALRNKERAATELYDACQAVLKHWPCHCRSTEDPNWHGERCPTPQLRAAIAKADNV